jgi:EmrB/QacA subfamily drug resistance transporter
VPVTPQLTQRQIVTVIGGLMVGLLLAALDGTIVATALPTIAGKLGGLEHIAWVATAYLLTSTSATPLFGKLSDLYGRRRMFQVAIVIFLIGSALCGMAQSFIQLVLARGVQGIGGGGLMSMAFVIVGGIVPPRQRGRYVGFFTSTFAVASIAGPVVGGYIIDNASWRWIFTINLPIGIAALFITSWALRLPHERREHVVDWLGAGLLVSSISGIILTSAWGGREYPWGSATILGLIAATLVAIVLFVMCENRAAEPILPMYLFRNKVFRIAAITLFFVSSLLLTTDNFLPLFMQTVTGASATRSGLLLTPLMAGVLISSISSGRLISRYGRYKVFPVVGLALMSSAVFLFTRLAIDTSRGYISAVQFLMGLGIGQAMPTTTLAVQNSVEPKDLAIATASASFLRNLGGSIGLASYGAVFAARLNGKLPPEIAKRVEDPQTIKTLAEPLRSQVTGVIAHAVQGVYQWALPAMLAAWVLTWFLPELPLRDTQGAAASADADLVVPAH